MELPNYANQLLLQLNQQRSKGFLCDVIIMVENTLFRAHKSVLAATSHYFKSLVLHDNLIHLDPDMVDPVVFQQILDFIYTGKLEEETFDGVDISSLLTTANFLQLNDLANLCSSKINQNGSLNSGARGSSKFSIHLYEDHSSDTETYTCMTPPKKRHNAESRCISRKKQELLLDLSKKNSNSETTATDKVFQSRPISNNMAINMKCVPKEEKWIIPLDGAQERKRAGSRRKSKVNGYVPPSRSGSQSSQNQTFTLQLSVKKEKGIGGKTDEIEGQKPNNGSTNFVYQKETFLKEAEGDNPYVCIPCEKGFPSSESLKSHVESHLDEDVDVKVEDEEEEERDGEPGVTRVSPEAPESLEQSPVKSLKDVDTVRPFPCNICGKMFTQRGTMTRHMRSHLGLKPFACEECGMRFTRQYRLTEHMRVHSGEKPYKCQVCGGKFTQQRNLISHMRMHTSVS
ncbi:hypermethylated in cancer 2 protein-like [Carassius auratus]|uniref:Hypermethylated in cancer 2 protein n=1 Tax=Carassius auratus TaxID=7957 RepID=A0A6P6JGV8_CARAU|nr:hypermethylated in cancer 2 protein-like [Carassius auratus]XP_026058892.1 hypermethylated in cancer 2 protein-like [Carassius auratus]XP_026058893.1 hypermethylated in cancer 2 protein-like [Carassius auratus]XP_052452893.1 hypermethylated in cancer 2 protein [Carassius gibelio]XP_052452895.1 hypermethylated in cancer 2 protein [Carassius gibelio]XP_052452896.1 hypermethylated in cancer 2 protein [Carassius gibelio]